jgi:uncharacterized membrane protein YhiD involved in acid resistance
MTQAFWWPGADVAADIAVRLAASLVLGAIVAWIYRKSRGEPASSFTVTLVLLAVLIAMVTQVIGDNVARAFSLVGALSIVRFRTVVRDTQDTAYVIFSVAVGMAVGAATLWVAVGGMAIIALAAWAMRSGGSAADRPMTHKVTVRVAIGHDADQTVVSALQAHVTAWRMLGASTARQGAAIEVVYRVAVRKGTSAAAVVAALNRLEGVQGVEVAVIDENAEPINEA